MQLYFYTFIMNLLNVLCKKNKNRKVPVVITITVICQFEECNFVSLHHTAFK